MGSSWPLSVSPQKHQLCLPLLQAPQRWLFVLDKHSTWGQSLLSSKAFSEVSDIERGFSVCRENRGSWRMQEKTTVAGTAEDRTKMQAQAPPRLTRPQGPLSPGPTQPPPPAAQQLLFTAPGPPLCKLGHRYCPRAVDSPSAQLSRLWPTTSLPSLTTSHIHAGPEGPVMPSLSSLPPL